MKFVSTAARNMLTLNLGKWQQHTERKRWKKVHIEENSKFSTLFAAPIQLAFAFFSQVNRTDISRIQMKIPTSFFFLRAEQRNMITGGGVAGGNFIKITFPFFFLRKKYKLKLLKLRCFVRKGFSFSTIFLRSCSLLLCVRYQGKKCMTQTQSN